MPTFRLGHLIGVVVIGLIFSSVAFRSLSQSAGVSMWASDSTSRMRSQHAVVTYGAALAPQELPPPPPPPLPQQQDAALPVKPRVSAAAAASAPPPAFDGLEKRPAEVPTAVPDWLQPEHSYLAFNEPSKKALARVVPKGATLHFTFGSSVMMDFVKNWIHFVRKAKLEPFLIGAADAALLKECDALGLPAAGIDPELDVWTYKRKEHTKGEVYEMKSEWKYFRHHNSDFLEMGLVKVAFLWELLSMGFNVLISDLDVVWLNGHWQRWMTWADAANPPVAEATLLAMADVLVTTDELNAKRDAEGGRLGGMHTELNTGVVHFRAGPGALAMVQQWRKSMLSQKGRRDLTENVNDQSLFNQVVRGGQMRGSALTQWRDELKQSGAASIAPQSAMDSLPPTARVVHTTTQTFPPCLPDKTCTPVRFTFGTLPMRPFTGGHTWFNQNVQEMPGHEQPQYEPITVHFTFQFGDTGDYPHGKRQRAREAALWAVDPPEYFTEGIFVAMVGPEHPSAPEFGPGTYEPEQKETVYKRFPEWSPQRHMFMDAPQRQAVRDLLGLSQAVGGIVVLPKFYCHCDRYWGFLTKCRMPHVPEMPLPFNCPMDSLYDTQRWNKKGVKFREHTFLTNPNVPESLLSHKVRVTVAAKGVQPKASTGPNALELAYGTPMSEVKALVLKANPAVRVIEIANADLRRLCRWLGSRTANKAFNLLLKYIATESSRYCPTEDMGGYGGPGFDWQNPFTAYNCTWGFHHPAFFPETDGPCARADGIAGPSVEMHAYGSSTAASAPPERSNSTTCPRQMLCDYNTLPDGRETKPITWCNIEGYNGMRQSYLPTTRAMLAGMPDGRCPYPPGDKPGMTGFDNKGHYVGGSQTGAEGRGGGGRSWF